MEIILDRNFALSFSEHYHKGISEYKEDFLRFLKKAREFKLITNFASLDDFKKNLNTLLYKTI